jgi:hypothetical protein
MKRASLALIRLYQKTISPDHGWFSGGKQHVCRFHPTCSEYTYQAIEKYGTLRGVSKGGWRILRCNPFNKGGFDPLK